MKHVLDVVRIVKFPGNDAEFPTAPIRRLKGVPFERALQDHHVFAQCCNRGKFPGEIAETGEAE